jgi:myo-inositol catabolism protein IolC
MEVFDGISWISINQNITVGMTVTAEEAIRWASKMMKEESELKAKMEKYPALKHAYEQYKMVEALVYEEDDGL